MNPSKTVLTTGEVAKICNVAPRTVSKWFDAGQLRGYRIPGSKDRRIPIEHLIRFMRAHKIPLNGLDGGRKRVLLLDADPGVRDSVLAGLVATGIFEVETAASALEAGATAQSFKPHVLVIDVDLPDANPAAVVRFLQCSPDLQDTVLVAVGKEMTESRGRTLVQQGFSACVAKPFELKSLIEAIEQSLESSDISPADDAGPKRAMPAAQAHH